MEGANALGLIAEVGIGIVGFTAIVVALRARDGQMATYTKLRVGALLFYSGSTVVLALLPFAFAFAGLTSTTIWSLSSWIAVLLHTTGLAVILRVDASMAEQRAPGAARLLRQAGVGITPFLYALLLANAIWLQQLWPFYAYLLSSTALSLVQFGVALFLSGPTELGGGQET